MTRSPSSIGRARGRWSWSAPRWAAGSRCWPPSPAPIVIAALIGIAAAPDFTEALMWEAMTFEERATIMRDGVLHVPSQYGEPYPVTRALIEDGRDRLLLNGPIAIDCPVRLLHGQRDPDVPWEMALRIAERVTGQDVAGDLVKDGDHRLSRPQDLALLRRTLAASPRRGWRVVPRGSSDSASAGRAPAASAGWRPCGSPPRSCAPSGSSMRPRARRAPPPAVRCPAAAQPRPPPRRSPPARRPPGSARARQARAPAASPPARRATMSSRWMRPNAWPGLMMRRAVPARRSSNAERPGP